MKALASVLLILVGIVTSFASDLLIRAQGLDNRYGIEAHSWDVCGSILIGIGVAGFVLSMFSDD